MSNLKFLAVINNKSLGINLDKVKGDNGIAAPLYRVVALINGAEVKTTTLGDSIKFSGEIEVTVYETGQVVKGFAIYFPGIAEEIVNSAFKAGTTLQIALEIGAKPSKTAVGYEYTVDVLTPLEDSPALSEFAASLGLPAILAPSN